MRTHDRVDAGQGFNRRQAEQSGRHRGERQQEHAFGARTCSGVRLPTPIPAPNIYMRTARPRMASAVI
jgi:hypothetical protein